MLSLTMILLTGCGNKKVEDTNQNNNDTQNKVLGTYSRKVFSNNEFEYVTASNTANFKFNSDSTFECTYENGITYKGIY